MLVCGLIAAYVMLLWPLHDRRAGLRVERNGSDESEEGVVGFATSVVGRRRGCCGFALVLGPCLTQAFLGLVLLNHEFIKY